MLWSCALLTLPIVAGLIGDRPTVIVVTSLALGCEALFSALPNQPEVVRAMRVTDFYGRGYLWFQGVFWTLLISFIIWRLWVQVPK